MTEKAPLRRIVIDPTIMLGKPVIRGTRLAVEIIVEKIGYGAAFEDITKDYPFILLRVDTPRRAASSSYRRTPDQSPGQAPVSRGPDWIPPYQAEHLDFIDRDKSGDTRVPSPGGSMCA